MTSRVLIAIPENSLDDYSTYGRAIEYDQREGRLIYEGGTLVRIDGETLQFPRAWLKHIIKD